jgi:3-methyl-2-oxobutanoate hydroxymethyltransferase
MKKVTQLDIRKMKEEGRRIVMITAYDYPFARIFDPIVDIILVGDSLGTVLYGHDTTLPVTMDDMIRHTKAAAAGRERSFLVSDMPFMSFQVSTEGAVENACRLVKEGGAEAVKLEGGVSVFEIIGKLTSFDVPVMGHIGLTPQSIHRMGGYRIQGREEEARRRLLDDARAVEEAGAFSVVLEGIPAELATEITGSLAIPTIGIGAGPGCDGQVLVMHDLLGLLPDFKPKFVKRYAELVPLVERAVSQFAEDVRKGDFPGKEHTFYHAEKR